MRFDFFSLCWWEIMQDDNFIRHWVIEGQPGEYMETMVNRGHTTINSGLGTRERGLSDYINRIVSR